MEKREKRSMLARAGLAFMIWILAFQSPLENVWDSFSYIDEIAALFGACLGLYDIVIVRKGRPTREQLWMGIPLLLFIVVGLAGNLIYQYQPLKCVIIDLYTNLKFFFAIGTGYYLFNALNWEEMKKTAGWNARMIALLLFILFFVFGVVVTVRAATPMTTMIAAGYTFLITIQALLNFGVATHILPTTGISLPFFSYGGTANFFFMLAGGMILCVSKSGKQEDSEIAQFLEPEKAKPRRVRAQKARMM